MAESLDLHLASAIKQALLSYESDVVNGDRGMIDDHVNDTVRRVKAIFNADASERQWREMINPRRGIQINMSNGS